MNQCAINQYIQREGDADRPIKVSVIVPIYNAGDRIYKCLDTLVNQTLREIEIICVLDCPSDGTDRVVEAYAKKDDRIVIVRNEHNLHVSGSRNEGLKVARGEYIGFSDHDDYRELDMYELLYQKAKETDADFVYSDTNVIHENGEVEIERFSQTTCEGAIRAAIEPWEYFPNVNRFFKCIWCNIYRKEFLERNKLRFVGWNEIMYEDELFNCLVLLNCHKMSSVGKPLYTWFKSINSTSNTWFHNEEMVRTMAVRMVRQMEMLIDALQEKHMLKEFEKSVHRRMSEELHVYYPRYASLKGGDRQRLASVLKSMNFPLLGRYNLKLLSKKRVKLFFFVLKLKLDGRKA